MLLVAILAAAAQPQSPVYLACHINQEQGAMAVDVAVDEPHQRVTIGLPSGLVVTREALFGPDAIKVADGPQTWHINRVDLTLRRTFGFSDEVETGSCKMKPVPAKRAL